MFANIAGAGSAVTLVGADLTAVPGSWSSTGNMTTARLDASPEGGRIRVELVDTEPDWLELHVIDEGPGMSENDRRWAFDRFWQGAGTQGGHSGLGPGHSSVERETGHGGVCGEDLWICWQEKPGLGVSIWVVPMLGCVSGGAAVRNDASVQLRLRRTGNGR